MELQCNVNTIYIDNLMGAPNGTELDAASKNTLVSIAYQNAATGGPGVYMARAILHLDVEDILNIGSRKANQDMKEKAIEQISNSVFRVSPNPNNGHFYLDYILGEKPTGNVLIQDLSGRTLLTFSLSSHQNKIYLNCEELQSGYYLLKIFEECNELFSSKIVVVK
jgi:hypothetical protein